MKEEKEWTTSWSNSNGQKKILLPGTRNIVSVSKTNLTKGTT